MSCNEKIEPRLEGTISLFDGRVAALHDLGEANLEIDAGEFACDRPGGAANREDVFPLFLLELSDDLLEWIILELHREEALLEANQWHMRWKRLRLGRGWWRKDLDDASNQMHLQAIFVGEEYDGIVNPDPVQGYRRALGDGVIQEDIDPVLMGKRAENTAKIGIFEGDAGGVGCTRRQLPPGPVSLESATESRTGGSVFGCWAQATAWWEFPTSRRIQATTASSGSICRNPLAIANIC